MEHEGSLPRSQVPATCPYPHPDTQAYTNVKIPPLSCQKLADEGKSGYFKNDVFPFFFFSCKANARVYLAKTGHGPHSSQLVNCVVLCIVCV
jgi:hypothetical protein